MVIRTSGNQDVDIRISEYQVAGYQGNRRRGGIAYSVQRIADSGWTQILEPALGNHMGSPLLVFQRIKGRRCTVSGPEKEHFLL